MLSREAVLPQSRLKPVLPVIALAAILLVNGAAANALPDKVSVLQIGATGTLTGNADGTDGKAGRETLHQFIQDESGLDNQVKGQMNWQDLAGTMAKGDIHLGVFQGHEFAWAQEKNPDLKPLVLGVNGQRYSVASVLTQRDNPAADFAGLKGQSLAVPSASQAFLRLFIDRRSELGDMKAEAFFSRITAPDNVEDALDEVVDGKVQAVVIDQATLEAYKRRKPGRFEKLKELARSQQVPLTVVAYYGKTLDAAMLQQFKTLLLAAADKEKGEMLLTLSRLTRFEKVADNFGQVLAETLKTYPPAKSGTK